jgi:hypothetical protein
MRPWLRHGSKSGSTLPKMPLLELFLESLEQSLSYEWMVVAFCGVIRTIRVPSLLE